VFPKIYRYSRSLLAKAYELPHITAPAPATGRNARPGRHVLPVAGPQMIALAGSPSASLSAPAFD